MMSPLRAVPAACLAVLISCAAAAAPLPAAPPAAAPATATAETPVPKIEIGQPDLFEKSLVAAVAGLRQYGEMEDEAARRRVADIGYRVAAESGFTAMPLSFYLIEMPEPNALALPGGQIFVTRGMLDLGLDDDMLAALLGHEIAHVVERHGVRMERRAMLLNLLGQAAVLGVLVQAERSDDRDAGGGPMSIYDPNRREASRTGDLVQGTAAASLVVSELLLRSYSRDFEDEADEEGQRWASAAGFDPRGAQRLMERMRERIPENREYGYWRTHPFVSQRIAAAGARAAGLRRDDPATADAWREATQAALLAWLERPPPGGRGKAREEKPRDDTARGDRENEPSERELTERALNSAALVAWPQGPAAEGLRRERLRALREAELAKPELSRDYGRILERYHAEIADVVALTPDSPFVAELRREEGELAAEAAALLPRARAVLREGVYEIPFLEAFASNYPDAPERARVAMLLGDAYSRLRRPTDAVVRYLEAWSTAPDSSEGQRAAAGLRNLAPVLDELAALQELANEERDPELQRLASSRLAEVAGRYDHIVNGAEYLRRFPSGPQVETVTERLNFLAQQLYSEVVLYQSVGEHVKAMQRIQEILTHAPLSPAAARLRERTVVPS